MHTFLSWSPPGERKRICKFAQSDAGLFPVGSLDLSYKATLVTLLWICQIQTRPTLASGEKKIFQRTVPSIHPSEAEKQQGFVGAPRSPSRDRAGRRESNPPGSTQNSAVDGLLIPPRFFSASSASEALHRVRGGLSDCVLASHSGTGILRKKERAMRGLQLHLLGEEWMHAG